MKPGRIVAIDHGTKRIGTAVSDRNRVFAFPSEVFYSEEELVAHLRERAAEGDLGGVVVGLPLNMDGSEGDRAREVRAFCDRLREALDLDIVPWDERLSSFEAEELLRGCRRRGEAGKEQVDAVAAQCILQSYLASHADSS